MKEDLDKVLDELREAQDKATEKYGQDSENFWESLSYEDKLKCFYSVCKRIHKGELEDKGTYRYVLYDIFGFGTDAYAIGMMCGFLNIHNSIVDSEDKSIKKDDFSSSIKVVDIVEQPDKSAIVHLDLHDDFIAWFCDHKKIEKFDNEIFQQWFIEILSQQIEDFKK